MLKTDLFDENGAFVGASAVEIVQPGIAPIGPYSPFSAHFTIPNDVLQRLVKNKQELAMLQRLGALSSVVEQHLDRLASPKATAVSQRKGSSASLFSYDRAVSSEPMSSRPRDSSHQPLEESHFFDSSPGHILFDTPDALTKNGSYGREISDKEIMEATTAMGSAISDMQKLKSEIERYYSVNSSLVEELIDQNCPELAEQKRILAESERFLMERLERLSSDHWTFAPATIPWR